MFVLILGAITCYVIKYMGGKVIFKKRDIRTERLCFLRLCSNEARLRLEENQSTYRMVWKKGKKTFFSEP